jgi:hypothetical protein
VNPVQSELRFPDYRGSCVDPAALFARAGQAQAR